MKVGFIGVGLIGGSMLKRLAKCGVQCFIMDTDAQVLGAALKENNAQILENFEDVDMLLLALSDRKSVV